ncbi:MAG: ABC transporter permease [Alphaproteobacteria bacterium]|nr:ABC transporter permease [Alphaproteobacteria bacterium]
MTMFLTQRALALLPVLFLVIVIAFVVLQLIPGDPAVVILGIEATPERVAQMRTRLGLDLPLHEQFLTYLVSVVRGDLGRSIFLDQAVGQAIVERAPVSLMLAAMSLFWAILFGIPAGIVAATRRGSAVDDFVMTGSLLGMSVPSFWLGLNLILVFGVWVRWFPTGGYVAVSTDLGAAIWHMMLPSLSLGFIQMAQIGRMTRSAMLETLSQDYIRTARAKGLSEFVVVGKHAFRNCMLSIVTVVGLIFAELLGGAIITEQIFSIPGIGEMVITAVAQRDYPIIQGALVMVGAIYVLINFLTDVAYGLIDPRVRIA